MQATQASTLGRYPEELDLGYHTLTFDTDSDDLARQAAERINAAVKAEYARLYPRPLYSLELEIVAILPGSRRVVTKAKAKKTIWGKFREIFLALGIFGSTVTGIASFDESVERFIKRVPEIYRQVIPETPTTPPATDYKWDLNKPVET